jgi:hypothetical protein
MLLAPFATRHQFINLDHALTFNRDNFEFFGIKLNVLALRHFVSLDDVVRFDILGVRIDLVDLRYLIRLPVSLFSTWRSDVAGRVGYFGGRRRFARSVPTMIFPLNPPSRAAFL